MMAGGKGTRAASIASDIPKPMIPVCGKPILEHQLECLKKNGLTDIVLVVGHLGQKIKDYFGSGNKFGCSISYYTETEPLGTAGALYRLPELSDDFILLNGDIIFDIDFSRMIAFHRERKAWATLAVHPNSHPFDSALIISDAANKVTGWLNKEDERLYYKNQVNSGVHILSKELLANCPQAKEKIDLDRDILKPSIPSGRVFAYATPEYIKDMGTPERYAQVSADIEKGIVKNKNLSVKQKCVFLDRDGTINTFIVKKFVNRPEDFTLIDGAAEAIRTINNLGYLAIVITNQPVIARGDVSIETLDAIHQKMETELGRQGAYLDGIFYCPHHPDKGFPGERPEYKIDCECRKPKPGMILRAAEQFNVDIAQSYMVGDDIRDVRAGLNAGCKTIFLTRGDEIKKDDQEIITANKTQVFSSLKEFAKYFFAQDYS
ncbi:MAG: D-glycero-beta-D-manno-heptose 1,7-bisphosphate 7-phosphatase [Treponema sp.]|nr:D-glycero-beta-D-manno-heptose 1,7-bisphosphate 7-phosphatase [Treponema sp.]